MHTTEYCNDDDEPIGSYKVHCCSPSIFVILYLVSITHHKTLFKTSTILSPISLVVI